MLMPMLKKGWIIHKCCTRWTIHFLSLHNLNYSELRSYTPCFGMKVPIHLLQTQKTPKKKLKIKLNWKIKKTIILISSLCESIYIQGLGLNTIDEHQVHFKKILLKRGVEIMGRLLFKKHSFASKIKGFYVIFKEVNSFFFPQNYELFCYMCGENVVYIR